MTVNRSHPIYSNTVYKGMQLYDIGLIRLNIPGDSLPYEDEAGQTARQFMQAIKIGGVLFRCRGKTPAGMEGTTTPIIGHAKLYKCSAARLDYLLLEIIEEEPAPEALVRDVLVHQTRKQFRPKERTITSFPIPNCKGVIEIASKKREKKKPVLIPA